MTRVLLALAVLAALVGCGVPTAAAPTSPAIGGPVAVEVAEPVAIRIPSIDVTSPPLVRLGLDEAGTLSVPPLDQPEIAGWFGVRPGDVGPSIVAAHRSGRLQGSETSIPGLFASLPSLAVGDQILIDRSDGTTAVFGASVVGSYGKDSFPTQAVYGDVTSPQLRVVTCGGAFDSSRGSYTDNVIVFADLVEIRRTDG